MPLNSDSFLAACISVTVVLTLATLVLWTRMPGPAVLRTLLRLVLLVLAQAAAVLVVLVCVNDKYSLYDSWDDLTGNTATGAAAQLQTVNGPALAHGRKTGDDAAQVQHAAFRPGPQGLLVADPVGARSHVHGNLLVWLPPQYNQPDHRGERFPVVELLPGQPGSPMAWFDSMNGQDELESLIEQQQARPMILVAAKSNTLGMDDAGCVDLPGGPHTETWLATDVPAIIKGQFRVSADPYDWSVMGYSAGGYCAVNLAVHHPGVFHSAVSISGYNAPEAPAVVEDHPSMVDRNNPLLVMRRKTPQPDVRLLLTGTMEDGDTVSDARALLHALKSPASGSLLTVAHGGHNMDVWEAFLPQSFEWINRQLR